MVAQAGLCQQAPAFLGISVPAHCVVKIGLDVCQIGGAKRGLGLGAPCLRLAGKGLSVEGKEAIRSRLIQPQFFGCLSELAHEGRVRFQARRHCEGGIGSYCLGGTRVDGPTEALPIGRTGLGGLVGCYRAGIGGSWEAIYGFATPCSLP
jgi:hypothetical protein